VQNNVDDDDDESSLWSWTPSDDCDEYLSLGSCLSLSRFCSMIYTPSGPLQGLALYPSTLSKHFIKALYLQALETPAR